MGMESFGQFLITNNGQVGRDLGDSWTRVLDYSATFAIEKEA
jgi:hypothetical protein